MDESKLKEIFDNIISKGIRVKGNAIKREVVFEYVNKNKIEASNEPLPKQIPIENEAVSEKVIIETEKSNANFNQNGNFKQADSILQDMKMELHKYKNELTNLIETHKNLKNRVEMEKSKDIQPNLNSN